MATFGDRHARFHRLFSPRTFFSPALGTTDAGALRNLCNEGSCMAHPEEIAGRLRPFFAVWGSPGEDPPVRPAGA